VAEELTATLLRLRPARAVIDMDRLAANYRAVVAAVPVPLMPVVKADAYGHGAVEVARRLAALGAPLLAVAYVEEAVALRQAGLEVPLVVLAGFGQGQAPLLREHRLTPVVSTRRTLAATLDLPAGDRPLSAHVKVDTGMGRLGFAGDAFVAAAERLAQAGVPVEGAMTHLASADEDPAFTGLQLDRFDLAVAGLQRAGISPRWIHACNSAGLAFVRPGHTLARPGLILYGVKTRPLGPAIDVSPVMTVSGDISLLKDVPAGTPVSYGGRWVAPRPSRIATIPLGYADAVPRTEAMRDHGTFVIRGRRAPVAGTVCMDLTMADVTGLADVQEGDPAVLFGDDPGVGEVAERAGTLSYEVLTSVGSRVPRVYVEGGATVAASARYLG
jgi:alanine racemase